MTAFSARIESLDWEAALNLLRLSGITVDLYSTGKNIELFGRCIQLLHEKYGGDAAVGIIRLVQEASIFDWLFGRFEEFRTEAGLTAIPDGSRKFPFLLAGQRIINRLKYGGIPFSPDETTPVVSDSLGTNYEGWIAELAKTNVDTRVYIYEAVTSDLSFVLKFIHHRFSDSLSICNDEKLVSKSAQYFNIVHPYKAVHELYERWRFFNLAVKSDDHKKHILFHDPEDSIFDQAIDAARYLDQIRVNQMSNGAALHQARFDERTRLLPPSGYLMLEELVASDNFSNRLHTDDIFGIDFYGVTVAEWARAYSVIMQLSRQSEASVPSRGFLRISKSDFQKRMVKRGIRPASTSIIISQLLFDPKKSVDLFDAPLLETNGGDLVLFYCVCSSLNFGEAFLSNLQSAQYDLSKRGFSFEKRLLGIFRNSGFAADNLHSKVGEDEYQCDLAVLVDQEIYLIEAKVFFEPRTIRRKYEHIEKVQDAVTQLARIADYYSANPALVLNKLKVVESLEVTAFHRVVVTSTMYSSDPVVNGVYVVDFSSLHRFLAREPLAVVGHQRGEDDVLRTTVQNFPEYEELYTGKLTSSKFQEFLKGQPSVSLAKSKFAMEVVHQPVGNTILSYKLPVQKVPTTSIGA